MATHYKHVRKHLKVRRGSAPHVEYANRSLERVSERKSKWRGMGWEGVSGAHVGTPKRWVYCLHGERAKTNTGVYLLLASCASLFGSIWCGGLQWAITANCPSPFPQWCTSSSEGQVELCSILFALDINNSLSALSLWGLQRNLTFWALGLGFRTWLPKQNWMASELYSGTNECYPVVNCTIKKLTYVFQQPYQTDTLNPRAEQLRVWWQTVQ